MEIICDRHLWEWAKQSSWSGARERLMHLTPEEMDTIEENLVDIFDTPWDETNLNDFFWFEEETYIEWIGLSQEEFDNRWKKEPIWK